MISHHAAFKDSLLCLKNQTLTQLRCFAENKGVRPELADRSIIEALVTDGAPEAAAPQGVDHVCTGPDRSDDTAIKPQKKERQRSSAPSDP